jgi:hypothetical protein
MPYPEYEYGNYICWRFEWPTKMQNCGTCICRRGRRAGLQRIEASCMRREGDTEELRANYPTGRTRIANSPSYPIPSAISRAFSFPSPSLTPDIMLLWQWISWRMRWNGDLRCVTQNRVRNSQSLSTGTALYFITWLDPAWFSAVVGIHSLCGLVVRVPCYRSRGPRFDSQGHQIFWEAVCLEWSPISLVKITEQLLEWKRSSSGSRKSRLKAVEFRCADHATPSIRKKLALTSPTCSGCSVGTVRLRTKAVEFS